MNKRICAGIVAAAIAAACVSTAYPETIILPKITQIEAGTFMNDTSLDEVVIANGTTSIGEKAFAGSGLKQVSIPPTVLFIAEDAFDGCEELIATIDDNPYALAYCASHGITVYQPVSIAQQYLQDGVITLPEGTAAGSTFTLNITTASGWTVTSENEPGTSDWFKLDTSSGTGSGAIRLTVSSVPGKYSNVKVRDHFLTHLTFTTENEETLTVPVVIYKSSDPYPNTYWSTGNYLEDLIGVALTQVGYQGSNTYSDYDGIVDSGHTSGDYQKYGRFMEINGNPWCASFVSWCAFQAGIPTTVMKYTTYASPGDFSTRVKYGKIPVTFFIALNDTQIKNHPYLLNYGSFRQRKDCHPVRGDLIFFRWANAVSSTTFSHVGIVLAYDDGTITYIDGNGDATDSICIRTIDRLDKSIAAYVSIFD